MEEDFVHFAGDPATDSPRRHLERVLKEADAPAGRRARWPLFIGLLAGGGSWTLWRLLRQRRREREAAVTSGQPRSAPPRRS
jgi:hypothetical protein